MSLKRLFGDSSVTWRRMRKPRDILPEEVGQRPMKPVSQSFINLPSNRNDKACLLSATSRRARLN